ncbi:hypothetical protein [Streptomyces sp. NBC_00154]|uniref:hypothetical protein n=1 Tax=Streptomyces sp. NBC_00154 TaxID=2975670 RepID=UPI002251846A|nr:hypothetical protein [Streptomyces sp. NBC_00154]MCX5318008.1 hypothetical protein [Streptomyces sp. NBC_00154]
MRTQDLITQAETEFFIAQPGMPEPGALGIAVDSLCTMKAAARGAVVRGLYNPVALDCAPQQDQAVGLIADGAEVRVTGSRFPQMTLIDGTHLLIDNYVPEGTESNGGWHITERCAVMWAREVYLMLWNAATRWQGLRPTNEQMVTTERQRRILRELEAGSPQHEISARTGMKQRTIERELLSLRERLGGWTIYQVMSWWGSSVERGPL